MDRWKTRSEIFRTMPPLSFLTFCLAVAFTFAAVGVVSDLFDLEHSDGRHLILKILTTAGFSVLWVLFFHRRSRKTLIVLAAVQILWMTASARLLPAPASVFTAQSWRVHVAQHGFLILVFILFSYGWFGTLFNIEGKRYFAAHTEIELATRIQRQLVPPLHFRNKNLEAYGLSVASGAVGGDLLDLVEADGVVYAYVADVAGHGVAAGVLMSMVKTATRMHILGTKSGGKELLEAINRVLNPITDPSSYVTFAYLEITPDTRTLYSVAAHLPLFHFKGKTGEVVRRAVENLPIAMFPDVVYETADLEFEVGDVIAIVTDGLTEVFNSSGEECGEEYIKNVLRERSARPLPEISDRIYQLANGFGKASDDQTLLLVRRTANE